MQFEPSLVYIENHVDDRGQVYGVSQYVDHLFQVKRIYIVENFSKGMIRAFHGHKTGWTAIHVLNGAAKVIGVEMRAGIEATRGNTRVISDKKPAVFIVPPNHYNGTMSLQDNTKLLIMSSLTLEECKQDDPRLPWDYYDKELWTVINR